MLKKTLAVLLVTVLSIGLIFAADTSASEDRVPETLAEKFSYALGILCASNYGTDYAMMYFSYYQYYNFPEIDEYFGALGMYDLINGAQNGFVIKQLRRIKNLDMNRAGDIFMKVFIFMHGMACMAICGELDLTTEEILPTLKETIEGFF